MTKRMMMMRRGAGCVMPNPHTLNDERSRQGLSMRPGRARDEQKK